MSIGLLASVSICITSFGVSPFVSVPFTAKIAIPGLRPSIRDAWPPGNISATHTNCWGDPSPCFDRCLPNLMPSAPDVNVASTTVLDVGVLGGEGGPLRRQSITVLHPTGHKCRLARFCRLCLSFRDFLPLPDAAAPAGDEVTPAGDEVTPIIDRFEQLPQPLGLLKIASCIRGNAFGNVLLRFL